MYSIIHPLNDNFKINAVNHNTIHIYKNSELLQPLKIKYNQEYCIKINKKSKTISSMYNAMDLVHWLKNEYVWVNVILRELYNTEV